MRTSTSHVNGGPHYAGDESGGPHRGRADAGVRGRGSGTDRAVQRMGGQREVPRRPACLVRIGRPSGRDVTPYEERKLWLLNGSHSLLAYAGSIRGHTTIDDAIADSECRSWVEQFWAEAGQYLTLGREA